MLSLYVSSVVYLGCAFFFFCHFFRKFLGLLFEVWNTEGGFLVVLGLKQRFLAWCGAQMAI